MKIRAILETETMDPDFKESFLNGMPFDITESTFDRIVRYASGCTDVQQPNVIAMVIQHSLDNRKELSELLNTCNHTTQMRVLIPVPISSITFINQYQNTLKKALKERIKGTKTLRKMKLKITTLVIVEEGQVQDIYHSLNDNQDKAYEEIIDQVNAEYGDGGVLQFYSLQGIKEYFEIVYIQTQELTSIGFKTAILDL